MEASAGALDLARYRGTAGRKSGPGGPAHFIAWITQPFFQVVLFAVGAVRHLFGESGLIVSGAVLGLTDVDALTISMTKAADAGVAPAVAAKEAAAVGSYAAFTRLHTP